MEYKAENLEIESKCKVSTWKNNVFQARIVSEAEALKLKAGDYDFYYDTDRSIITFKLPNGKLRTFGPYLNGISGHPLLLLIKLMKLHGRFASPYQIGSMHPQHNSFFINENIIHYAKKLRDRLFGESADNPSFILKLTNSYRLAFNGKKSFCLIEPAENSAGVENKI